MSLANTSPAFHNPLLCIMAVNSHISVTYAGKHREYRESFSAGAFIWSVADLLRGDFKQSQYGRIILPFTLLRRLECVLEPTKTKVLAAAQQHQSKPDAVREKLLLRAADLPFFNASPLTWARSPTPRPPTT